MSESNDERLDRKKRERREYLKQQAEDKILADKLDNDPQFAADFDKSIGKLTDGLSNDVIEKFAREKGYSASETAAMKKATERARKTAKGTLFGKSDPEKAEKILMSSRGIRELRKDKSKGCAVIAVLLLGIGGTAVGAALWSAVEIVSALS